MTSQSTPGPPAGFSVKPVLTGKQVILRQLVEADAPQMMAGFDAEGSRLTGSHSEITEAGARRWYASLAEQDDRLDLAVVDRANGALAGEVVLNEWDPDNHSCSFRILLLPSGRGRGLGSEATRMILEYGFEVLGLNRVSLEVYAFNPRARRVYRKAGFVSEGTLREALHWEGEWIDAEVMSILAREWSEHRGRPVVGPEERTPNGM
jgi:RimJ/RimL family protein N-acetyltransferase